MTRSAASTAPQPQPVPKAWPISPAQRSPSPSPNTTVHIVGLGFDPDDARLAEGLAATRGGRGGRAQEMARQLAQVGIQGAYEGALKYVGNPELISRTHFARFLVKPASARTRPRSSANTSPKASPATCRTAGRPWATRCAG